MIFDEPWDIVRPGMAMDKEQTINEAFIDWAVIIGQSKEGNSLEISISWH